MGMTGVEQEDDEEVEKEEDGVEEVAVVAVLPKMSSM